MRQLRMLWIALAALTFSGALGGCSSSAEAPADGTAAQSSAEKVNVRLIDRNGKPTEVISVEKVVKSDAEWRAFLKGLAANSPMFVASFGPTPAPIETGEKLIGISMPKYIVTKAPAPLDWARVSQPMMGTPRGIGIAAKAPHPNAARLFVDYWLSKEAMKIMADQVGEYVLAPGVYPPIAGIDKAKVIPIRELSDEEIKKWGAEFKKIFAKQ